VVNEDMDANPRVPFGERREEEIFEPYARMKEFRLMTAQDERPACLQSLIRFRIL
jgi:hypothetical protein